MRRYEDMSVSDDNHYYTEPQQKNHISLRPIGDDIQPDSTIKGSQNFSTKRKMKSKEIKSSLVNWFAFLCIVILITTNYITFLATYFTIDKSDAKQNGIIKPAFFASIKVNPYYTVQAYEVVKFDDVRINRGGGYNPVTAYFTAPRQGLYHICCMILGFTGDTFHFQLNKNEAVHTYGYIDKVGNHAQTISVLVEMKEGDCVFIKHRFNVSQRIHGGNFSNFSGYLVSE